MKAKITIGVALFLIGGALPIFAQSTAYASIFATVIAPVGISKTTDMSFNEIDVSKNLGTVSFKSGNTNTTSGVKPEQNGKTTLAAFSLTDSNNSTFDITLPTANIMIGKENTNAMIVSNFSSTQVLTSSLQGTTREIRVGADLQISENQTVGNYNTQNPFPVTLNYN